MNANLSYLPSVINNTLSQNGGQGLKHLYFLPDIWDTKLGQENWTKLNQNNKEDSSIKARKDFELNIQYRLNKTLKDFSFKSEETKHMVEDLFNAYYKGTFSPNLFGAYFDGKAFWEELPSMSESQIQKTATRYWEAFTAVSMYGALDASMKNPITNSQFKLDQYKDAKNQLKNVVNYMRILPPQYEFKTLEDYKTTAAQQGVGDIWYHAGILNLAYEARIYRGVSVENMHTLEDASGAYQTPIIWLNKFNEQINKIEDARSPKHAPRLY